MRAFLKSIFRNPTFWSGVLLGCVLALLTLTAASAVAQSNGDTRSGSSGPSGIAERSSITQGDIPSPQEMSTHASPQVPEAVISTTITYQGVLRNGSAPATGSYDFLFRLYDATISGTLVSQQAINGVAVQGGQFTVGLDFGGQTYSSQALWLEIAVRPSGGTTYVTLSPRQPLSPAPLALGLPNVTTDPNSGFVGVGRNTAISSYEVFGVNRPYNGQVGMYITGGGASARPFYGYATDDTGNYEYAWTEYNGVDNEWQLYMTSGKAFGVKPNGDTRAAGNFSQPATANGLVKAAAHVECWGMGEAGTSKTYSSFNSITGLTVTVAAGSLAGECFIDFGFNLQPSPDLHDTRFFQATAMWTGEPRGVNCDVDQSNTNRLRCMRWRINAGSALGTGGPLMVTVY